MIISVAEERALAMRARVARWREEKLVSADAAQRILERFPTPWRSSGILAQIVGFGLTAFAVFLFAGFWELLLESTLIAGIVALGAGEWLIRRERWWSTGVESALWVGGLFALITAIPGESKPEALLLFAAASIAGFVRLRQPWFGALAALLVIFYFDEKDLDSTGFFAGVIIGLLALALLYRTWKRPSTEWLLIALLLVGPPTAAASTGVSSWLRIVIFGILGAIVLAAAVRLRLHTVFIAAGISLAISAVELQDFVDLRVEVRLALAGALLLGVAAVLSRILRGRTTGFVSTPPAHGDLDDLLEAGAVTISTPRAVDTEATAENERPQGGGGFGGAGATGDL